LFIASPLFNTILFLISFSHPHKRSILHLRKSKSILEPHTTTKTNSDGHAMDRADVLHALREAGRVDDSFGDKELNTIERLRDGQVKLGATRYEKFAGSQR
jgi:hypothetical protein